MVRSITGTLLDVGRGRLPPGTVRRLLRTKQRRLAGTTAPARGLTLISVHYGPQKRKGNMQKTQHSQRSQKIFARFA